MAHHSQALGGFRRDQFQLRLGGRGRHEIQYLSVPPGGHGTLSRIAQGLHAPQEGLPCRDAYPLPVFQHQFTVSHGSS